VKTASKIFSGELSLHSLSRGVWRWYPTNSRRGRADSSLIDRRERERVQTMQDLIEAIKPILPNALVIDTDSGILIETNLELGLGGLLQTIEREGEV